MRGHELAESALKRGIISTDAIMMAAEESMVGMSDIGYCLECGAEHFHVEPDAVDYPCEICGADAVYGAEEILLMAVG